MITITPSFSKSSVFKIVLLHTETQSGNFEFLWFELKSVFEKLSFRKRISVDGRPNRRNKAGFSNFSGEVRMGTKSRDSLGYVL